MAFARHYDVRCKINLERRWMYYHLYGLERACELTGVKRFAGYDWHFDGAMKLLASQKPDGSWKEDPESNRFTHTCFALLFLKKSMTPAYTGR